MSVANQRSASKAVTNAKQLKRLQSALISADASTVAAFMAARSRNSSADPMDPEFRQLRPILEALNNEPDVPAALSEASAAIWQGYGADCPSDVSFSNSLVSDYSVSSLIKNILDSPLDATAAALREAVACVPFGCSPPPGAITLPLPTSAPTAAFDAPTNASSSRADGDDESDSDDAPPPARPASQASSSAAPEWDLMSGFAGTAAIPAADVPVSAKKASNTRGRKTGTKSAKATAQPSTTLSQPATGVAPLQADYNSHVEAARDAPISVEASVPATAITEAAPAATEASPPLGGSSIERASSGIEVIHFDEDSTTVNETSDSEMVVPVTKKTRTAVSAGDPGASSRSSQPRAAAGKDSDAPLSRKERRAARKSVYAEREAVRKQLAEAMEQRKIAAAARRPACVFYQQGRCRAGDKCEFAHVGPAVATQVCMHFIKGKCNNGDKCPFSHDLSGIPCRHFHGLSLTGSSSSAPATARCERGTACPYSHAPLSAMARLQAEQEMQARARERSEEQGLGGQERAQLRRKRRATEEAKGKAAEVAARLAQDGDDAASSELHEQGDSLAAGNAGWLDAVSAEPALVIAAATPQATPAPAPTGARMTDEGPALAASDTPVDQDFDFGGAADYYNDDE